MENLALASSSSKFLLTFSPNLNGTISIRRPLFAHVSVKRRDDSTRSRTVVLALSKANGNRAINLRRTSNNGMEAFASFSSSSGTQTSSVGVNPGMSIPPPNSQIGSPLFWVGVGVGLSALFSWVAANLKKYAMQQAFKTLMGQMPPQNSPYGNTAFSPGSPFPFPPSNATTSPGSPFSVPTSSTSINATSPSSVSSQPAVTVDVPASKVEAAPAQAIKPNSELSEVKEEPKKYAFVDVSAEEKFEKVQFQSSVESPERSYSKDVDVNEASLNGATTKQDSGAYNQQFSSERKPGSPLSVEALEKMMEDPTVQKMVYPYLPEEMRNPTTFKWMLQNPEYRKQLEDMLNNMGGNNEWDSKMMDSLKNFDISSPEVKQQFDQIGLTPEEVISKIMANPDVAMAFQNPRVQAAIMDCSQNPLNIAKYQNDMEVMAVFNKISELFPGVTGSP